MINIIAGTHAPDNVVAFRGQIVGHITFIAITAIAITGAFTTAIIVADNVITVISGVTTGTYPGNG
jgi:hypothetical protein